MGQVWTGGAEDVWMRGVERDGMEETEHNMQRRRRRESVHALTEQSGTADVSCTRLVTAEVHSQTRLKASALFSVRICRIGSAGTSECDREKHLGRVRRKEKRFASGDPHEGEGWKDSIEYSHTTKEALRSAVLGSWPFGPFGHEVRCGTAARKRETCSCDGKKRADCVQRRTPTGSIPMIDARRVVWVVN